YDSHPLMKVVSKFTANELNCIPENIGKYKAMYIGQLRFFDSFQHMAMRLDKLVACLGENPEKFSLTVKHFTAKDDGLDPSHYVSAPGMFNDSLYKSSGAELKLMTDMDEYLMVEKGIREGMTLASHQYAKVNNPQCPNYDPSKPIFWTMYEDLNTLYSGTMTQYMPTEIIGKVGPEEVPDIQTIAPNAEIGYMPEVDLEVPAHLYDFFADYLLVPEKQIVLENWLSLYNAKLVQDKEVGGGKYVTGEKLVQTLYPKKNYVFHYRALQLYMRQRLKVTKIHGILKFKQSSWMKEYIEKNIRKRKIAKANSDEFRDKTKGSSIDEAVCLKPKMYSILPVGHDSKTPDNPDSEDSKKKHNIQKAKGVKKCVVKRELQHDKFLECLRNKKLTRHDMYDLPSEIVLEEAEERAMKAGLRFKE
ncbi:12712_t:CDS:2, partial [Dentiscutata erythropus]